METMHGRLCEVIALKAKAEGVPEEERARTDELARRIGRDRKLQRILSPPDDEEGRCGICSRVQR